MRKITDRIITDEIAAKILGQAYDIAFCRKPDDARLIYTTPKRTRREIAVFGGIKSLVPGFHLLLLSHEGVDLVYQGSRMLASRRPGPGEADPSARLACLLRIVAAGFRTEPPTVPKRAAWDSIPAGQPITEFPDEPVRWLQKTLRKARHWRISLGFFPLLGAVVGAIMDIAVFDRMSRETHRIDRGSE